MDYEHKVVNIGTDPAAAEQTLNTICDEGWNLSGVVFANYKLLAFFSRYKHTPRPEADMAPLTTGVQ